MDDDLLEPFKDLVRNADVLTDLALTLGLLAIRIADAKSATAMPQPSDRRVPYEFQRRPFHLVAYSCN